MKHYSLLNTREALTGKISHFASCQPTMCHRESFQCFNGYTLINWKFQCLHLSQTTLKVKLTPEKQFASKLVCFTILEISISGKSNETLLTFKHQRSTDWQDKPFCQLPTYDVPSRKLSVLQWVRPD